MARQVLERHARQKSSFGLLQSPGNRIMPCKSKDSERFGVRRRLATTRRGGGRSVVSRSRPPVHPSVQKENRIGIRERPARSRVTDWHRDRPTDRPFCRFVAILFFFCHPARRRKERKKGFCMQIFFAKSTVFTTRGRECEFGTRARHAWRCGASSRPGQELCFHN